MRVRFPSSEAACQRPHRHSSLRGADRPALQASPDLTPSCTLQASPPCKRRPATALRDSGPGMAASGMASPHRGATGTGSPPCRIHGYTLWHRRCGRGRSEPVCSHAERYPVRGRATGVVCCAGLPHGAASSRGSRC